MVSNIRRWLKTTAVLMLLVTVTGTFGCAALLKKIQDAGGLENLLKGVESSKTFSIEGMLYQEDPSNPGVRQPATGAQVTVKRGSKTYQTGTNGNGYFSVDIDTPVAGDQLEVDVNYYGNMLAQKYQYTFMSGDISKGKYTLSEDLVVFVSQTQMQQNMSSYGTIKGYVLAGPVPIPDCEIVVKEDPSGTEVFSTYSQSHGDYLIPGLALNKSYKIFVTREGFAQKIEQISNFNPQSDDKTEKLDINMTVTTFKLDTSSAGVINAYLQPSPDSGPSPLPAFIDNAQATLIQPNVTNPYTVFVDPSDMSFKFFGIAPGSYQVRLSMTVVFARMGWEQAKLDKLNGLERQEFTATVNLSSMGMTAGGLQLPIAQRVLIAESNEGADIFGLADFFSQHQITDPFGSSGGGGMNRIWIEQNVKFKKPDGMIESVQNAVVVLKKDGTDQEFVGVCDWGGHFGMELTTTGKFLMSIYLKKDPNYSFNEFDASQFELIMTKNVTVPQRMFDSRSWYPGGDIMVPGELMAAAQMNNAEIRNVSGELVFVGDAQSPANIVASALSAIRATWYDPITNTYKPDGNTGMNYNMPGMPGINSNPFKGDAKIVLKSTKLDYQVELVRTQVSGQYTGAFTAAVKALGEFQMKIVTDNEHPIAKVRLEDPYRSYFVDQFSMLNLGEVRLVPTGVNFTSKITCPWGGLGGVSVQLKRRTNTISTVFSEAVTVTDNVDTTYQDESGSFYFSIGPDVLTDTQLLANLGKNYKIVLYKEGVLSKSFNVTFKKDGDKVIMEIPDATNGELKVVPSVFTGNLIPYVKVWFNSENNVGMTEGSQVILRFKDIKLTTGVLQVTGNFVKKDNNNQAFAIVQNVPAIDTDIEIKVKSGNNLGQANNTFRLNFEDIKASKWDIDFDEEGATINVYTGGSTDTIDAAGFEEKKVAYLPQQWGNQQWKNCAWIAFDGFTLNDFQIQFKYNGQTANLEGAEVTLTQTKNAAGVAVSSEAAQTASGISDSSGWVRGMYVPIDGTYAVTVSKNGMTQPVIAAQVLKKIEWDKGFKATSIQMSVNANTDITPFFQTSVVSAKVKGAGTALKGAYVIVKPQNEDLQWIATTNAAGEWSLTLPRIGEFDITVTKNGYVKANYQQSLNNWSAATVDFWDQDLQLVGAGGWWNVNDFKINRYNFEGVAPMASVDGMEITVRVQKDGIDLKPTTGGNDYTIKLLDTTLGLDTPITGITFTHLADGVYTVGTMDPNVGKRLIAASTFGAEIAQVKLAIYYTKSGANTKVWPNANDVWQNNMATKYLPEKVEVPSNFEANPESYSRWGDVNGQWTEIPDTFTKFTWTNAYKDLGISGERYRIRLYQTTYPSDELFSRNIWLDSNTATTMAWELNGWEWVNLSGNTWNSIQSEYPDGFTAGTYYARLETASDLWNPTSVGIKVILVTDPKMKK